MCTHSTLPQPTTRLSVDRNGQNGQHGKGEARRGEKGKVPIERGDIYSETREPADKTNQPWLCAAPASKRGKEKSLRFVPINGVARNLRRAKISQQQST